jgi:hypothetical protein
LIYREENFVARRARVRRSTKKPPPTRDLTKYFIGGICLVVIILVIVFVPFGGTEPGRQTLPDEYYKKAEELAYQGLKACIDRLDEGGRPHVMKKVEVGAGYDAMAFPKGEGKYTAISNGFYKGAQKSLHAELIEGSDGYFRQGTVKVAERR